MPRIPGFPGAHRMGGGRTWSGLFVKPIIGWSGGRHRRGRTVGKHRRK